jgi:hypothetical protein
MEAAVLQWLDFKFQTRCILDMDMIETTNLNNIILAHEIFLRYELFKRMIKSQPTILLKLLL